MKATRIFSAACALLIAVAFADPALAQGQGKGGKSDDDKGRLSPASLDLDTCGCPTTFEAPYCEELIRLGYRDGRRVRAQLTKFIAPSCR